MRNATLAIGNEIVAKRLLNFAKKCMKKYEINFSEGIEIVMRNPKIWKGYENKI